MKVSRASLKAFALGAPLARHHRRALLRWLGPPRWQRTFAWKARCSCGAKAWDLCCDDDGFPVPWTHALRSFDGMLVRHYAPMVQRALNGRISLFDYLMKGALRS